MFKRLTIGQKLSLPLCLLIHWACWKPVRTFIQWLDLWRFPDMVLTFVSYYYLLFIVVMGCGLIISTFIDLIVILWKTHSRP